MLLTAAALQLLLSLGQHSNCSAVRRGSAPAAAAACDGTAAAVCFGRHMVLCSLTTLLVLLPGLHSWCGPFLLHWLHIAVVSFVVCIRYVCMRQQMPCLAQQAAELVLLCMNCALCPVLLLYSCRKLWQRSLPNCSCDCTSATVL
jgi:hypothetical protein